MADPIRIQKAIAHSGLMSRRAAEEAIARGRVRVGSRIAILGDRVDVDSEIVLVDETPIPINPAKETHLLYKPVGVISTSDDPQGRRTVVDLVRAETRLYPVGRLDAESEGLILLSNDGDLANLVTHPKYQIVKTYLILTNGRPGRAVLRKLVAGVELEDGIARALSARIVDSVGGESMLEMKMGEGRNREIRRMLLALGFEVNRLIRTAIGPIGDSRLKSGESRRLSNQEVWSLIKAATGS